MTFTESIKTCFYKYATFKGRASRAEFWWFVLFFALVNQVVRTADGGWSWQGEQGWVFQILWWLVAGLPVVAVSVRRLHDVGFSGWWLLAPVVVINLVPIISIGNEVITDGYFAHFYYGTYGEFPTCESTGCALIGGVLLAAIGVSTVCFAIQGRSELNKYGEPPDIEPLGYWTTYILIVVGGMIAILFGLFLLGPFLQGYHLLWVVLPVVILMKLLINNIPK